MSDWNKEALGERIGRAIARQRQRSGLTQEQVAERLGLGTEAVSRIERGIVVPGIIRLFELAEALGCEAGDLLGETSPLPDDRARHLARLLAPLESSDREMLVGVIEQLSERLGRDYKRST